MSAAQKVYQHPFLDRDVIMSLANGVTETLQTMSGTVATFDKPYVSPDWTSPCNIAVLLELQTDPFRGQVRFHFDRSVAQGIIEKMLGSKIDDVDLTELLDGVGEISNIFYGLAKTKLNALGFKLNMSVPKPCPTKELPPVVGERTTLILPFKVEGTHCFIELILFS